MKKPTTGTIRPPKGWKKRALALDEFYIGILGFHSEGRALFYSGKAEYIFDNWDLAATYAKVNDMVPIEATDGGRYLSKPDRATFWGYTQNQVRQIWRKASRKYAKQAEGDVRTFVCCSRPDSTFRSVEHDVALANKGIKSINEKDRQDYRDYRRAAKRRLIAEGETSKSARAHARYMVYRRMAIQEVRIDFAEAARTKDAALHDLAALRLQEVKKSLKDELPLIHRAAADARAKTGKPSPLAVIGFV